MELNLKLSEGAYQWLCVYGEMLLEYGRLISVTNEDETHIQRILFMPGFRRVERRNEPRGLAIFEFNSGHQLTCLIGTLFEQTAPHILITECNEIISFELVHLTAPSANKSPFANKEEFGDFDLFEEVLDRMYRKS